jgi:hypothetical protein
MKYLVLIFFLQISTCSVEADYYKKAFNYISENGIPEYATYGVKEYVIPFNLVTVSQSVLSENYIDGYTDFKELSSQEIGIRNRVIDSLQILERDLNSDYLFKSDKTLAKLGVKESEYTILFSEVKDNMIYAEVMKSDGIGSDPKHLFGEALTYLIIFEEEEIKKVYKGSVHHN